ncbi:hypothetical protein [Prosthecomicrobium hirschii]|uniref:hypothetical protein n=1 Tax=Prosthecodimorpha hirschii TaxID=665126 RepID=UPI00221E3B21|nr:hypothetical protein [Prosthecomicrobium hirschii]MCW1844194.1 hypothetical protein [Prosthecomicrobium hirschii]
MTNETFVIGIGTDHNDLYVERTKDGFGSFQTEEAAAQRLLEMVESRMSSLQASRTRARRLLRRIAARSKAGGQS